MRVFRNIMSKGEFIYSVVMGSLKRNVLCINKHQKIHGMLRQENHNLLCTKVSSGCTRAVIC